VEYGKSVGLVIIIVQIVAVGTIDIQEIEPAL
jgi:hypothetical protein